MTTGAHLPSADDILGDILNKGPSADDILGTLPNKGSPPKPKQANQETKGAFKSNGSIPKPKQANQETKGSFRSNKNKHQKGGNAPELLSDQAMDDVLEKDSDEGNQMYSEDNYSGDE